MLAGPPVRDQWVVVFFRDLDNELVSTRRVWLRGNTSGRWAQVLFFAAGGAGLDSSLVPATVLDADLHFYPGRAGLRAAVGATYAEAVPVAGLAARRRHRRRGRRPLGGRAGRRSLAAPDPGGRCAAGSTHDERGWTFTDTDGSGGGRARRPTWTCGGCWR